MNGIDVLLLMLFTMAAAGIVRITLRAEIRELRQRIDTLEKEKNATNEWLRTQLSTAWKK